MRRPAGTFLAAVFLGLAALATPASAAAPDKWLRWKTATPALADITARSLDFNGASVFTSGETGGVYTAPGSSVAPWSQVNTGLDPQTGAQSVRQVKVGPDGLLYASTTAGLFRSQPPGNAWQPVGQGAGPRKLNMGGVQGVVFPSPNPADIVAAVAGAAGAGVYYSSDGGANWDRASGMPVPTAVFHIAAPVSGTPMYAATDRGVWISLDFGRSWVAYSDGIPPGETVLRVAFPPSDPTDLYVSTSSGLYRFNKERLAFEPRSGTDGQTLPAAGGKRAVFLTPPLNGQFGQNRGVVGTEQGVWGTIDGGEHWGQMSTETFPDPNVDPDPDPDMNRVVWALNLGFTQPTLLAGTAGFGVFTILLQPVEDGDVVIGPFSPKAGDELTHQKTGFAGTRPIFFKYQWKRCVGMGCTPTTSIPGATGPSYVVPKSDAGQHVRYRLSVEARNLVHPSFHSDDSSPTADANIAGPPGDTPMPSTINSEKPKVTPSTASQAYGATFTVDKGRWRTEIDNTTVTAQTTFSYQWRRCKNGACEVIADATGPSYTTTTEDIAHNVEAYIRGTRNGLSSPFYLAGIIGIVQNRFPANTIKPQIIGDPFTGFVLSSNVGAWSGFDMRYERRWLRCDANGLACNPTSPVVTASSYGLTAADKNSRLVLEVKAIAEDESQERVTTVTSDPTPVITDPPVGATPIPTPQLPVVKIKRPKKLKPGAKLKVPASFAGFRDPKYQWLRNGKKIKGATKRVYKIKKKDRGKKLSCRITLTPVTGGPAVVVKTKAVKVPKKKRRRRR